MFVGEAIPLGLAHEIYISEFVLRELRDVMMRLNFDRDDVDEIEKFLSQSDPLGKG
ncbi:hypothetical protein JGI2_01338 [Candidatus Kryptobacter tengchongensis]|uniref:Uncharacterized protein n=1 Tax=Candidatus Chryseopegocella kryptomonas TaxID=1633643 RepID=A0A0P1NW79_9BACT|nr:MULTISPECIES: hypothetical protein [Candidatus Kryptonia]CUT03424.1 hypothetical protein JGI23_01472 [Candidatus Chrysopegis kryptomonas]CUU06057.1 hypothetical protein JGI2_01338 [Candidatus Kryptobacter tengchongensis]